MTSASHIADAIGRKRLAASLGVGVTAVSNAVVREAFPASWFPAVSELANAAGVDCPLYVFNWKSPVTPSARGAL